MNYTQLETYSDSAADQLYNTTAHKVEDYTVQIKRYFSSDERLDDILYSFVSTRLKEESRAAV